VSRAVRYKPARKTVLCAEVFYAGFRRFLVFYANSGPDEQILLEHFSKENQKYDFLSF
jgi:hypothetical protein